MQFINGLEKRFKPTRSSTAGSNHRKKTTTTGWFAKITRNTSKKKEKCHDIVHDGGPIAVRELSKPFKHSFNEKKFKIRGRVVSSCAPYFTTGIPRGLLLGTLLQKCSTLFAELLLHNTVLLKKKWLFEDKKSQLNKQQLENDRTTSFAQPLMQNTHHLIISSTLAVLKKE